MDEIEKFQIDIINLITNSKLPISIMKIILQNSIYQLDIIKLKTDTEKENKIKNSE